MVVKAFEAGLNFQLDISATRVLCFFQIKVLRRVDAATMDYDHLDDSDEQSGTVTMMHQLAHVR